MRQALERVDAGAPTTAAMAPKAPIGATHMIIARDAEDEALRWLDAAQDRLARAAHRLQREADQQGDEQRLEHRAARSARRTACPG